MNITLKVQKAIQAKNSWKSLYLYILQTAP